MRWLVAALSSNVSFAKRLSGFAGLPFLSMIAPFLLLPLIARIGGVEGWAAVAIGQSIGAFAAIVVSFGWALTGPSLIASLEPGPPRDHAYAVSFAARSVLFLGVAPFACLASAICVPGGHEAEGAFMAFALALGGLSPAWYCVGVGRPGLIARYEVLPRLIGTGIAAACVLLTDQIFVYPAVMAGATVAGLAVFHFKFTANGISRFPLRDGIRALTQQKAAAATGLVSGTYSTTPVSVVGAFSEMSAVAAFASGDKLYRVGLYAVIAVGNTFQGWVAEIQAESRARRMKAAVVGHAVLGLIGMAMLGSLGPTASAVLFGEHVQANVAVCWGYGMAFFAVSLNTAMGKHVLVPLGQTKTVFWSTVLGACVGVPAIASLAALMGGAGGAWGLATGELAVCSFQVVAIARIILTSRRLKTSVDAPAEGSQPTQVTDR